MTGEDKRVSPRFAVHLATEIATVDGRVHPGTSRNLSRDGLCVEIGAPIPAGDGVTVRVTLVFDADRTSEPLDLPARVVWCTPFGDSSHQVGCQLLQLSSETLIDLDMFLRYLEQQAPSDSDDDEDPGSDEDPFAA
jgi:hypothetical protein